MARAIHHTNVRRPMDGLCKPLLRFVMGHAYMGWGSTDNTELAVAIHHEFVMHLCLPVRTKGQTEEASAKNV